MTPTGAPIATNPGVAIPDDDSDPTSLTPFIELPAYGVNAADRKWRVDSIIRELDQGQFANAARYADAMLRDARIRGAFEQRISGLFGAPLVLEPAKDTASSKVLADDVMDRWHRLFPRAALEEIFRHGITLGIGVGEKVWDTSATPWTFTMRPWHPSFLTWRWDLGAYVIQTMHGLEVVPERSTRWIVFAPFGYRRAFLMGCLRALSDPFLLRSWTRTDWGSYNERYGNPIIEAIVPQQSDAKESAAYVRSIANIGANTVIKSKQDKDGNKYAVELIEAKSAGWETFRAALEWSKGEISNVLLGQTMSTDGQGGLGAKEAPGKEVRQDITSSDNARLCECLYEQGVRQYVEYAYGNADLAPRPNYGVEPEDDELHDAQAAFANAQASSARIASGITTAAEEGIALAEDKPVAEVIDVESRRRIAEAHTQAMEAEAANAVDAANDPAPTPGEANKQALAAGAEADKPAPFGGGE